MVQQSLHNSDRLESTILNNLFFQEDYTRKVLPFLKEDYFPLRTDKILFTEIGKFVEKYNNLPTKEAIIIELGQRKDINEDELKTIKYMKYLRKKGYSYFKISDRLNKRNIKSKNGNQWYGSGVRNILSYY